MNTPSPHILIVDDSPEDRLTLRRYLAQSTLAGYVVTEVDHGDHALTACQSDMPDCVLLDYFLPDIDGLRVLTALRAFTDVPVIMLTGLDTEMLAAETFQHGAQDYLLKSLLTPMRLHISIQRALATVRLTRERDQSFAWLDALVRSAPSGIGYLDRNLRYQMVNPALARINGKTPAEHIGRTPADMLPGLAPRVEPLIRQVLATGQAVPEVELHGKPCPHNGVSHHWLISYFPIAGPDREVPSVGLMVTDITESKRTEVALHHAVARLRALHVIDQAILEMQSPAQIATMLIDQLRQLLPSEQAVVLLYEPDHQPQILAAHEVGADSAPRAAMVALSEWYRDHSDPPPQPWRVADVSLAPELERHIGDLVSLGICSLLAVPLLAQNTLIGTVVLSSATRDAFSAEHLTIASEIANQFAIGIQADRLRDQIEQERAHLAQRVAERTLDLSQANINLAQVARVKDEFMANMSHELRTPLNAILAFSESLLEEIYGPLSARQHDIIRNIEVGGRHLLALINDILDLTKVDAGQISLQSEPVSISDVCYASLVFVKEQALKKTLALDFHQNDELAIMDVDPKRLKQMLVNLLSNAVKFTPNGGKVRLDVAVDSAAEVVRFAVHDTGIGIAAQDLDRLFQPFSQLDTKLSRMYEGTGLGLVLVRRLAELHNGSVTVESTLGVGSCFTITLPYRQPISST